MRKIFLLLIVAVFFSCENKKEFTRVWMFETADFPDSDQQADFYNDAFNHLKFSTESFLNIAKTGKYTSYFGRYMQGEWEKKENDLLLYTPEGQPMVFRIRKVDDGELQLYYPPRGALYTFTGFDNNFASELESPFSYTNNKWREQPDRPQTDKEINERLSNYFGFYEKYFAWGDKIKSSVLSINNVPGPLQIYSNGFELTHYTQQPEEWKSHFYDSTEVKKAYMKIYYIFQTDNLDWNRDKGNFKMFESAFHQLKEKLK